MIYPDYDRSILSTTASLLRHFGVDNIYPTLPELDGALKSMPKHIALIITDGAGVRPLEWALPADSFMRRNIAATVTSIFPSTTTAATTSYYCAQSAYEHGWLGWYLYFKEYATDVKTFMRVTNYTGKNVDGPQPAPAIMPYETVFEKLKAVGANVRTYSQHPFPSYVDNGADEKLRIRSFIEICDNLVRICRKAEPTFSISYWTEPDGAMHDSGVRSDVAKKQFKLIDSELNSLSRRVNDTLIIVTADHGLIDCAPIYINDYPDIVDCLWMPPMLESRAPAFYVKPYRRGEFELLFQKYFGESFLLLSREDVYRTGIFGRGKRHPKFDDLIGDYVACAISDRCFMYRMPAREQSTLAARHSGLTADEMLVPVILVRT